MRSRPAAATSLLEHEAFVYDSDARYVSVLAPQLSQAVARGEAGVAVVSEHSADLLAGALGADAGAVRFVDAVAWYRNPVRTIAQYDDVLRRLNGTPATVVGEVQFGTTGGQHHAWTRYESVLNRALHGYDARVICPYDARVLPPDVVDAAQRTHPHLLDVGGPQPSALYAEPETLVPARSAEVAHPRRPADLDVALDQDTTRCRPALRSAAAATGFGARRTEEVVLALHEVVANAVLHGGGRGRLRAWWAPGDALVCVVEDAGPGHDDVLAGFLPPRPSAEHGYGLWLARALLDEVELGRSPLGGLAVTLVARAGDRL